MARLQLALDVADLDAAIDYYTRLFATPPHKVRDGYANFAIADPPLKLVLFEGGDGVALNHLGVEVEDPDAVAAAGRRFAEAGLQTRDSMAELCCHAVQDKVYAADPNGGEWEFYTILDDEPEVDPAAAACATDACGTSVTSPAATAEVAVPAGAAALPQASGCC